jgi:hypothetical protein
MHKTICIKVRLHRTEFLLWEVELNDSVLAHLTSRNQKNCSHSNGLDLNNYSVKDIKRPNLFQIFNNLNNGKNNFYSSNGIMWCWCDW